MSFVTFGLRQLRYVKGVGVGAGVKGVGVGVGVGLGGV
jgi:hypothetical protein